VMPVGSRWIRLGLSGVEDSQPVGYEESVELRSGPRVMMTRALRHCYYRLLSSYRVKPCSFTICLLKIWNFMH
jgi:hypothetical protein